MIEVEGDKSTPISLTCPEDAVPFLREQAEGDHARSQYNLGCCYANGEGVIEDMDKVNK